MSEEEFEVIGVPCPCLLAPMFVAHYMGVLESLNSCDGSSNGQVMAKGIGYLTLKASGDATDQIEEFGVDELIAAIVLSALSAWVDSDVSVCEMLDKGADAARRMIEVTADDIVKAAK